MSKDNKGIDGPKHHPGPAGDPRRKSTKPTDVDQPQPDVDKRPTKGPPEGYAEEQPGKSSSNPPTNKNIEPPKGTSKKVYPSGRPPKGE
jgi:hypothetical protein